MMKYHELVKNYVDNASHEDMVELTKETDDFIEEVRELHPEMVDKFLMKVDLVFNPHFTKETAKYVVSKMKNKDGSSGEHWDYDTTSKVLENKKYDFKPCDWYVALNMIFSDFYKSGRSDDTYIELAYDFLADVDAPKDKMKKYWKAMNY